ncbi:bile acid:sodium symporter family protein [Corynebacterium sanguinis]|uniref:bile acid:sodium symporter family protein n=1 Tax=Corynebacterium sanguinis TaxID=2594913 RepID=UPI00223B5D27|nr:bile acid:sodium symporter family protein [Corynebacterium sanguinis]MCT1415026.1 bile acid:sodium symporter family protein [Corynebacterium sanguinis]
MDQSPFIEIGLPIALFVIMIGIGLSLTSADFVAHARRPRASIVGLIGQLTLPPLLALGIAWAFGLTPLMALGVVLVAAAPGGATSNLATYLARGSVALSIILTVAASLAAIITLPLWMDFATRIIPGVESLDVRMPLGETFALLIGVVLAPVAIGMVLRAKRPQLAEKMERFVGLVGMIVLVLLIVFIVIDVRGQIVELLIAVASVAAVFNLCLILIGGLVGWLGRLDVTDQLAIAIEYSIRNTTLAMVLAFAVMQKPEVGVVSAVYSIVMYVTMFLVIAAGRRMVARDVATQAAHSDTVGGERSLAHGSAKTDVILG